MASDHRLVQVTNKENIKAPQDHGPLSEETTAVAGGFLKFAWSYDYKCLISIAVTSLYIRVMPSQITGNSTQAKLRITGPCITNVFATRRKNFSQWYRSFQRKLLSHWLKFLRHVAITLVIQGPGPLWGESTSAGGLPSQRASNEASVSIMSWCYHLSLAGSQLP